MSCNDSENHFRDQCFFLLDAFKVSGKVERRENCGKWFCGALATWLSSGLFYGCSEGGAADACSRNCLNTFLQSVQQVNSITNYSSKVFYVHFRKVSQQNEKT